MSCQILPVAEHHRLAVESVAQTRGEIQALLGGLRGRGLVTSDAHTAVDVDLGAMM